jgi:hypothetical protein
MSNYHYNDQSKNFAISGACDYSLLKDTTNYSCDQACLCRFDEDRSQKDKMYYNWFVLKQPMELPPPGNVLPFAKTGNCPDK